MGSPKGGSEGGGTIHAYIYNESSSQWDPYGSVIKGLWSGDAAGFSVSLSNTGFMMVVGFPKAANLNGDSNAGKTEVYYMVGTRWLVLGQEIYGQSEADLDGTSVAMSNDGSIVVVGGKGRNGFDATSGEVIQKSGYCSIYKFQVRQWELQHSITGKAADERMGSTVSVSPDGNIVACSGVSGTSGTNITTGVVRLWNLDTLKESTIWPRGGDDAEGSTFGSSVALSNGGEYVIIGDPTWNSDVDGRDDNVGAIQIFKDVMSDLA